MKRFECQLCGGKLRGGKCELCGWVNQNDSDYLLNKSSCDTKPLTHVHRENTYGSWNTEATGKKDRKSSGSNPSPVKAPSRAAKQYQAKGTERRKNPYQSLKIPHSFEGIKRKSKGRGIFIIVAIILLINIVPSLLNMVKETVNNALGSSGAQKVEDDLYNYVTRELADTGEQWDEEIQPGIYKVGVDIPEGLYNLETVSGRGSFRVDDIENGIYFYEFLTIDPQGEEEFSGVDELRLYKNAEVQISDSLILNFTTETGQTDQLESEPNPLTEEVLLPKGVEEYAGNEFAAGVYDLTVRDTWTYLTYETPMEGESEELMYNSVYMDSSFSEDGVYTFKNVELPEGTRIFAEDADVELTPSDRICPEG